MENELQLLQDRNERLEKEIADLMEQFKKIEVENKQLRSENKQLKKDNGEMEKAIEIMSESGKSLIQTVERAKKSLEDFKFEELTNQTQAPPK